MAEGKMKLPPEIEQLTEKLVADPKSRVFAQLADAYRKVGMLDEAIDTTKRGLVIHPNYAVAHLVLGRCYLSKKMYALAREEFELTIRNDPQSLVGYRLLAETCETQGLYADAVKSYNMVLALDPTAMEIADKVDRLKIRAIATPVEPPPPKPSEFVREKPAEAVAPPPPAEEPPAPAAIEAQAIPVPAPEQQLTEPLPVSLPAVLEEPPAPAAIDEQTKPEPAPESQPPVVPLPPVLEEPPAPQAEEALPQAAPEAKAEPAPEKIMATSTLAEVYAQQGHFEKAVDIYTELVAAEPGNQGYKNRLDALIAKAFPEEAPPEASLPVAAVAEQPPPAAAESVAPHATEPSAPELPAAPKTEISEAVGEIFSNMFAEMERLSTTPAGETPAAQAPTPIAAPAPAAPAPPAEPPPPVEPPRQSVTGAKAEVLAAAIVDQPGLEALQIPSAKEKTSPPQEIPQQQPSEGMVAFGGLFSESEKRSMGIEPLPQPAAQPPKEAETPAAPAAPADKSEPAAEPQPEAKAEPEKGEAVSSFQSWLSSLQK